MYAFPAARYRGPALGAMDAATVAAAARASPAEETAAAAAFPGLDGLGVESDFVLLPRVTGEGPPDAVAWPAAGDLRPAAPVVDRARVALWMPVRDEERPLLAGNRERMQVLDTSVEPRWRGTVSVLWRTSCGLSA